MFPHQPAMRIPETKIDEIRSASDIVDVISSYVSLKKRGKNFLGLCPFHKEKTPSFNVSPDKQMYHCFGCGVGGNAFTFVMELEKVSFIEAVRTLADRAGIALPTEGGDTTQATENEGLYNVCRLAGLHFHDHSKTLLLSLGQDDGTLSVHEQTEAPSRLTDKFAGPLATDRITDLQQLPSLPTIDKRGTLPLTSTCNLKIALPAKSVSGLKGGSSLV